MIATLLALMLLHPVHETVAEVEWNQKSQCLEVALRMSVLDAQWIKREHAKPKQEVEDWAVGYLRSTIRVDAKSTREQPAKSPKTKFKWIGAKQEGSHVWWFFEIHQANKQRPQTVENRFLMDRDSNYVNRFNVLGVKPARAITFSQSKPTSVLFPLH